MDPIEEYRSLRSRIDEEIRKLEGLHGQDITCHAGCATCCVNLTVFPCRILCHPGRSQKNPCDTNRFSFRRIRSLRISPWGLCRIYPFRPIICRTHGLPILFLNDSQEEPAWEVSFCELNFRNKTGIEFTDDTLLDIETINAELNRINDQFISSLSGNEYYARQRIQLKELCRNLNSVKEDPQRTC